MTVQPVMMVICAPAAGAISDRVGTRWPAMLGMALLAVAMYLLSRLGPTSSLVYIGTAIGTAGLGVGIFVAPNNSTMMGSAPKHRQGIAGGCSGNLPSHWHDPRSRNLRRDLHDLHPRAHSSRVLQWNPDQLPRRLRSQLRRMHRIGRPQMISKP